MEKLAITEMDSMGSIRNFDPVKLVIPTLVADEDLLSDVRSDLAGSFGPVDYESRLLPFSYTDYYREEMGPDLHRVFFSMLNLMQPEKLSDAKVQTDRLERKFAVAGRRRVNLDPGMMAPGRFILATTKDHAHRIPLRAGIYGEVTLLYHRNGFEPLPWTYPDYRTADYQAILLEIMALYRRELKDRGAG